MSETKCAVEFNTVYHMDNREGLAMIPEKSINLIISDPPYFEVKGGFDFVWGSFDEYLEFMEGQAKLYKTILADNGTLFVWGMDRKIAYVQTVFDKYFTLYSTLVWEKPSIANEWDTRLTFPERGQERILMYGNEALDEGLDKVLKVDDFEPLQQYFKEEREKLGWSYLQCDNYLGIKASYCYWDKPTSHPYRIPDEVHYKKLQQTGRFKRDYLDVKNEYTEIRNRFECNRRPFNNSLALTDILRFSRVYDAVHPTQKPEDLTRALILTCSRPGDTVCVPFAGSGTECAMSVKEGRKFIAFETNEKHVMTARQRVQTILSQPTLFQ